MRYRAQTVYNEHYSTIERQAADSATSQVLATSPPDWPRHSARPLRYWRRQRA